MPVQNATNAVSVTATDDGKVNRGLIKVSAVAKEGGCEVTVTSQHSNKGDKLEYQLYAKVSGRMIQIDTLAKDVEIDGHTGVVKFELDYADLTKKLRQKGGQNPNLKVEKDVPLAINCKWQTGHTWGLSSKGREGGDFNAP